MKRLLTTCFVLSLLLTLSACNGVIVIPSPIDRPEIDNPNLRVVRNACQTVINQVVTDNREYESYYVLMPRTTSYKTYELLFNDLPGKPKQATRGSVVQKPLYHIKRIEIKGGEGTLVMIAPSAKGEPQVVAAELVLDGPPPKWRIKHLRKWDTSVEEAIKHYGEVEP